MQKSGLLQLALLVMIGSGCYERVVYDWTDDIRNLSWAASPRTGDVQKGRGTTPSDMQEDGWAIFLDTFEGTGSKQQAAQLVDRLRRQCHLPHLWIKQSGQLSHVLRGKYPHVASYAAQRDFRQTRMVELDGQRPFSSADLVLLSTMTASDSLDVRQFKGRWPYTLQIAVFDKQYRVNARQAAKQRARELRSQGHQAFYYHGQSKSMVTIGLFSDEDRVSRTITLPRGEVVQYFYGPRIKALQEKFPYNRVNGALHYEQTANGSKSAQPSSLVMIK